MKISWKKGIFSSNYELLFKNKKIGELNQGIFNRSTIGKLNNCKVKFQKKGFFSSETEITDLTSNRVIGRLKFNTWGNKAKISINGKTHGWKSDSFWGKKWSITENGQPIIKYKSSTFGGEIELTDNNEYLLLSGLFIFNYYVQMTIIIASSSIIIMSSN
jgi:hypothetical protein